MFYDKATERIEKGFDKLSYNLLRYELKLKKNPSSFLNVGKLYAKDLFEKSVCKELLKFWYYEYKKIQKNSKCPPSLNFSTLTDLKNVLAAYAISTGELDIFRVIEKNIKKGLITPVNAHRCRKFIDEVQKIATIKTGGNSLLNELNTKMELKYKQCLKSI
jgi:hypothetical protein